MSETQSNPFRQRACGLWIAGALLLLAVVLALKLPTPPPSEPVVETLPPQHNRTLRARPPSAPRAEWRSDPFYRTIIDNNLFRPLGWTPPRPIEPYRLLGTILPTNQKTQPRAILQSTAGNQTYILSIGDTLDVNTKVVDIQPKQTTLEKAGQRRTLKLKTSLWMNAAKEGASHRR